MSQILSLNADNATNNDKQVDALAALDNSFEVYQRVRCFYHTLQLAVEAFLAPFHPGINDIPQADVGDEDCPGPPLVLGDNDFSDEDEDEKSDGGVNLEPLTDFEDDGIDELAHLLDGEREDLLEKTAVIKGTVGKVRRRFVLHGRFKFRVIFTRFEVLHSQLYARRQLPSLRGTSCVVTPISNRN